MLKHPRILRFSELGSYVFGASLVLYAFTSWASGQLDSKIAEYTLASQQSSATGTLKSSPPNSSLPNSGLTNSVLPNMDLPGEGTSADVDILEWSAKRIAAWRETFGDGGPEAFAMLSVPSAGINVPIFKGAEDRNLNAGAALIYGTDEPGIEYGNTGIAGHRDGFFRGLQNVKLGEPITINTNGEELSYRIRDITIVDPTNIDTLLPQQSEVVTLVTCYPFYFVGHAPQRYVVQAIREK